jgi:hypothetical protein
MVWTSRSRERSPTRRFVNLIRNEFALAGHGTRDVAEGAEEAEEGQPFTYDLFVAFKTGSGVPQALCQMRAKVTTSLVPGTGK